MKSLFTLFLTSLILLQPMLRFGITLSFQLNQKEIAKSLCVKKNIQGNTCQGKCYLKKQLKKAEEAEKKAAASIADLEKQLASDHLTLKRPHMKICGYLQSFPENTIPTLQGFYTLPFQPPPVAPEYSGQTLA